MEMFGLVERRQAMEMLKMRNKVDVKEVLDDILFQNGNPTGKKFEVIIPILDARWLRHEDIYITANLSDLDFVDNGRGGRTDLLISYLNCEFRVMGDYYSYHGPHDPDSIWANYCTYRHGFKGTEIGTAGKFGERHTTYRFDWKEVA